MNTVAGIQVASSDALEFANAFEMIVCLFALAFIMRFLIEKTNGWADLIGRFQKVIRPNFQGGAYDFAIAVAVILAGKAMRAGTVWWWRHFGGELNLIALGASIALIALGGLCVVRILSDNASFNRNWFTVAFLAGAFALWSAFT